MPRSIPAIFLLAVAAGLFPAVARAQSIAFVHESTIYEAVVGPLKAPEGVACTERGALVVGDTGNRRVLLFNVKEGRVTGGEEIKLPQLSAPIRLQIDSKGNVLALDGKTHQVVRIAANGTFGGTVQAAGAANRSSVVVGAFKLDARDNVYLLDVAGRRVLLLDSSGTLASEIPLPKETQAVTDIAVDAAGNLFALDAVGGTIWIAEKTATAFRSLASKLKDKMSFPTYLTTGRGRLFVVDRHGNGVAIFGADGSYMGRQLSVGAMNGLVNYPGQLCLTGDGAAYLADTLNNRVQVFSTGAK
ncbi:MAG: repeat containing protein [Myxococcaceae bacterium]|nr:repeat containing protein [Myxococcaceae bacterium]